MSTVTEVLEALKSKGSEQTRKTYARHGASGPKVYGVKVADMKAIAKTIKGEQDLALELYETGGYEAMYLAGMVANGKKMTKQQLESWAQSAVWAWNSEYTVPWVASESEHGHELALEWMSSKQEHVACAGWSTYVGLVATKPDDELDLPEIESLLKRVEEEIDAAPNRVKYCMNGFVIAVGSYVEPLNPQAKATAEALGKVKVDMGDTYCKVPLATDYIAKVEKAGRAGKKRKTIRC
ncbi:MAG: DNA alkylation repair protein [Acidobacteriota bacterium]